MNHLLMNSAKATLEKVARKLWRVLVSRLSGRNDELPPAQVDRQTGGLDSFGFLHGLLVGAKYPRTRIMAFSFLLMATATNNVLAQSLVRLEDPYRAYTKALSTEQWAVEDYARAKAFNLSLISSYGDLSQNLSDSIETVEAWNKNIKYAIDMTDLTTKLVGMYSKKNLDWMHNAKLFEMIKDITIVKPSEFDNYVTALKKIYPEVDREYVINALSQAAWLGKLGFNNGLGDSGTGDVYDMLMSLGGASVNEADATSFYDFLRDKTHAPWLNALVFSDLSKQVELHIILGGIENYASVGKAFPTSYVAIETAKIITDFGSAGVLAANIDENEARMAALEFLKYYLLGFAGNRQDFESALGKPPGTTWSLRQAFDAFVHANDYNGNMIGLTYFETLFGGIDRSRQDYAYILLGHYMRNNPSIALKAGITPRKTAYRTAGGVPASAIKHGDVIDYTISIEPYLIDMGCNLNRFPQSAQINGFDLIDHASTENSQTHRLRVARVGDVSLKQDVELRCGSIYGNIPLQHYFLDSFVAAPGHFDLSEALGVAASSYGYKSLSLSISTPELKQLFKGPGGEVLDVSEKVFKYWIEEETSPGVFELVWKKLTHEPVWNSISPASLTFAVESRFNDDAFFIARTGSRRFRMVIEIPNTDFLVDGVGHQLNWISQPFTVNAADVEWHWVYNPVLIKVADANIAAWQDDQRSLQLTADQNFTICVGATNTQEWGANYAIKLLLQTQDASSPAELLSQESWDAASGCAVFKATATGRYQMQHLFVDYLDDRNQRATRILTSFGNGYVQVLGEVPTASEGGSSGGGTTTATQPLNDTGINTFSNDNVNGLLTEPVDYPGQDARYGRDAQAGAGKLSKTGGGGKGFDYTKIANNGTALPAGANLGGGASDWACTRDNVTGLIWEVKTADGSLRDQNWTYSWYHPSSPDGTPGTASGGNCKATGRCDTAKYVADVNAAGLCGHNDWRMPTVKELQGIADLGRSGPAIDPTYFPNTPSSYFWSGSPSAYYSYSAWYVGFNGGGANGSDRDYGEHVRLVRGGQ